MRKGCGIAMSGRVSVLPYLYSLDSVAWTLGKRHIFSEAKRGWMSTSFLSHFLIEGPCKFIGPWPSVKQPMYMNRLKFQMRYYWL